MNVEILKPLTVLAAWSMIMWVWMYVTRLPALMNNKNYDANAAVGSVGSDIRDVVPPSVQWKADNYNHLMEQPTVFYAVAITLALFGEGFGFNAMLAWIYVGFRIAHSLVQVTINRVIIRFALHAIGTIPLLMLTAYAVYAVWVRGYPYG